jgi:glycosyltransferase involved in cell wall biosynthesis
VAKIAFLIADLTGGGAERVALSLVEGFVRRGHQVDLLLMRKTGVFLDHLPGEVRVIELRAARIRNVVRPLVRYLRRERPDALQVSIWPLPIIALVAARLAGVRTRVVLSEHCALGMQYGSSRATRVSLNLSTRLFYRLADRIICVSKGVATDLQRVSGLSANRTTVVYNPIEQPTSLFKPDADAVKAWPSAKYRILSVGTLKAQKNHRLLIEAFAKLGAEVDASLLILGEGPERRQLEDLIARLGLQDRVRLHGFTSDTWSYYAAASLFVLSSDYEGFGNVLVEALAWGLPIVSTDCEAGPSEILRDGEFGTLVDCGSAEALAQAMRPALDQPVDAARLKGRARDFSPDKAVGGYLEALLG